MTGGNPVSLAGGIRSRSAALQQAAKHAPHQGAVEHCLITSSADFRPIMSSYLPCKELRTGKSLPSPKASAFISGMKLDKVRFAVGSPEGSRSSHWVAFGNKSDFYFGRHGMTGYMKVSLHESGVCRHALDRTYWEQLAQHGVDVPSDRALTKWRRKQTPETGAFHVMSIFAPTDYLIKTPKSIKLNKPVFYFSAAPEGQSIEVMLFYSREKGEIIEQKLKTVGIPWFFFELQNGDIVSMVTRCIEFDINLLLPSNFSTGRAWSLLKTAELPDIGDEQKDLSAMLWNSPSESDALQLVEISGITLQRNS